MSVNEMPIWQLTYELPNGNWVWFDIRSRDFQSACENALQGAKVREDEGFRLIRVEHMPENYVPMFERGWREIEA